MRGGCVGQRGAGGNCVAVGETGPAAGAIAVDAGDDQTATGGPAVGGFAGVVWGGGARGSGGGGGGVGAEAGGGGGGSSAAGDGGYLDQAGGGAGAAV